MLLRQDMGKESQLLEASAAGNVSKVEVSQGIDYIQTVHAEKEGKRSLFSGH